MKRLRWGLLGGALLAVLVARPLLGEDLSGTWQVSYRIDHQTSETIVLELRHERSWIPGPSSLRGMGVSQGGQVLVQSGTVRGNDFQITLTYVENVGARPTVLMGSWYVNEMSGRADGFFGTRRFDGSRRESVSESQ